jgi:LysM repeat protein
MMHKKLVLTFIVSVLSLLLLATTAYAGDGIHVVQTGETLNIIARRYGVSTTAIIRANGIANPNLIRIGQRLVIPSGGSATSGATAKPATGTYVVRTGDTLAGIAQRLGVSTSALAAANGIANPNRIVSGMTLRVPGSSGSTGSSGTATSTASGTRFVASISAQRCWLYQGGVLVGDWRCSTGRRGAATMTGTFKVQSKFRNAYASTWDFYMPYWLGIYWAGSMENGIHGLPYNSQTGRQTWAGMVGTRITFGCIMLENAHAKRLWETAYIGMPVIVKP